MKKRVQGIQNTWKKKTAKPDALWQIAALPSNEMFNWHVTASTCIIKYVNSQNFKWWPVSQNIYHLTGEKRHTGKKKKDSLSDDWHHAIIWSAWWIIIRLTSALFPVFYSVDEESLKMTKLGGRKGGLLFVHFKHNLWGTKRNSPFQRVYRHGTRSNIDSPRKGQSMTFMYQFQNHSFIC